jgi:hypothetical protein
VREEEEREKLARLSKRELEHVCEHDARLWAGAVFGMRD